jgi:uncharacterized membrane protein
MRDHGRLISFMIVLAAFAVSALAFPHLPAQVPTHWGIAGTPDNYAGRAAGALTIPVVMLAVWALFVLAPRYDRLLFIKYDPSDADSSTVRPIYDLIITIVLGLLLAIHVFALSIALGVVGTSRQPLLIAIIASLGAVLIGNYMPRVTRRNAFIGFRVPWAYASEEVWRRTQRAAGYGMVLAGLVGFVGAVAAPSMALKPLFAAMLVQLGAVAVYSYWIAHSRRPA